MVRNYCFLVFQTLKMGHILPSVFNRLNVMSYLSGTNKIFDIKTVAITLNAYL